jgi:hypothetical protein
MMVLNQHTCHTQLSEITVERHLTLEIIVWTLLFPRGRLVLLVSLELASTRVLILEDRAMALVKPG